VRRDGEGDSVNDIRRRATRQVYENPWLRLREDEIEYADGATASYAVVEKQDFVTVIPYADGGFWLVQQFRYPIGGREWEFPQGGWPAGHSGTAEQLAATELAEETGLRADGLTHLGRLWAAYGYSSQAFDVYLATGLTEGEPDREPSEQDMVHRWFAEAEVRSMVAAGRFADSHSLAALALYDQYRSTR
jgi:8-oxo-dGTP pyrophosphatase MutT (NUDIX family)